MTRTSKRWILSLMAGAATVLSHGEPAKADGWLRRRVCGACETPAWSIPQPAIPSAQPRFLPQGAPQQSIPGLDLPKIDAPPGAPPGKIDIPPAAAQPPAEPRFEPLVSAALGDSSTAVSFNPAMFGDLNGRGSLRKAGPIFTNFGALALANTNPPIQVLAVAAPGRPVPGVPVQPVVPVPVPVVPAQRQVLILQFPQLSYASFKIAENESPRPTDRIFVTYNYYNGLPTSSQTSSFDVHRETVGFEKTFLDGSASIGVRVPFLQLDGPSDVFSAFGVRDGQFGDLSIIAKYAFYDDRTTGNLISGGLMVTAPTGDDAYTVNGQRIHSTLWQPWTGAIWGLSENTFVHGFSSVVVPTDSRDSTAWYNDLGVGYWLRKGQTDHFFHGIVPTAEVHVGTPLNHRGNGNINDVHVPDYVSLVGGVNFIFGRNSSIGIAAGAPVTGPKPWDFETHFSINFRF